MLGLIFVGACGPTQGALPDQTDGAQTASSLTGGINEGTPEAKGVLQVMNTVDENTLVSGVGFGSTTERPAAHALITARNGHDGVLGSPDDVLFTTLAQIDAFKNVGPVQFRKLLAWAKSHNLIPAGPCTWAGNFETQLGQVYSPDDIGLVLQSGRVVRGLSNLDRTVGFALREKASQETVVALNVHRPQTYSVVATHNESAALDAVASAVHHVQLGAAPQGFVEDTVMRLFTSRAWTPQQSLAAIVAMVDEIELLLPAADQATYHSAAQLFVAQVKTENLSGTTFERRGATRLGGVDFYPRAPWGWDAGLGAQIVSNGHTVWRFIAAAPLCEGCSRRNNLMVCEIGKSWADARAICEGQGGQLASTHSRHDDNIIRSLYSGGNVWIGLSDLDQEGSFAFTDETPVDYFNFAPTQPDNAGPTGENCVELFSAGGRVWWNDGSCDLADRGFVCEF